LPALAGGNGAEEMQALDHWISGGSPCLLERPVEESLPVRVGAVGGGVLKLEERSVDRSDSWPAGWIDSRKPAGSIYRRRQSASRPAGDLLGRVSIRMREGLVRI
jgi:hypothetical protein